MPGSTLRQCPHCHSSVNCGNRRCVKCGKLLDFKLRHTVRLLKFRAQAKEWAQTTKKSRNQTKVLDNSFIMMEKLKALGYFPLLLWGKYSRSKWRAQFHIPFEMPAAAHGVLEKVLILFEHILQGVTLETDKETGQDDRRGDVVESGKVVEMEIDLEEGREQQEEEIQTGTEMDVQEGGRQQEREVEKSVTDKDVEEGRQAEKGEMGEQMTIEEDKQRNNVQTELGLEWNVDAKGEIRQRERKEIKVVRNVEEAGGTHTHVEEKRQTDIKSQDLQRKI